MAINYSLIILCHTDRTDHTDLLFMSRRKKGNKGNYFRPRIDRMIRILYLSRKSQIAQKGFSDGFIEVVDVFLKINFHHTSLTSMAYSLYKMNKGLNFFEELMRASFQYSSNKIKHPSIRDNSFYSINSCSYKISVENVSVNICVIRAVVCPGC